MKHWQTLSVNNGIAHISSPTMLLNDRKVFESFKDRKELRQELDTLEKELKDKNVKRWVSWTLTSRPHVMRLLSKVNARPYNIQTDKDPAKDMIWFVKEI